MAHKLLRLCLFREVYLWPMQVKATLLALNRVVTHNLNYSVLLKLTNSHLIRERMKMLLSLNRARSRERNYRSLRPGIQSRKSFNCRRRGKGLWRIRNISISLKKEGSVGIDGGKNIVIFIRIFL